MNRNCVISLTGDPITVGHRDIAVRAAAIFDKVYVLMPSVSSKKGNMLRYEERKKAVERDLSADGIANFEVLPIADGEALVDVMRRIGCKTIVRGLRNEQDLVYEMDMSAVNRLLSPEVETVYLPCKPELSFVSSSMVRELVRLGKYETAEKFTSPDTVRSMKRACTTVIALTGGIACGKSTARGVFERRGWFTIDADAINREFVLGNPDVLSRIKEALSQYGRIDSENPAKSIAGLVFSDDEAKRKLESIAFPIIYSAIKSACENWKEARSRLILVETPLLFEDRTSEFAGLFDATVCVYATRETSVARLVGKRGMSLPDASARVAAQMPSFEKAKLCNYAVENSMSVGMEKFMAEIDRVAADIEAKFRQR